MQPPAEPVVFTHPVRVYWEDTDAGGVVFYANYLKFFERARTEWLRAAGVSQQQLRADTGAIFIVSATSVNYRQPARLDDLLSVTVHVVEMGRASMLIRQQAWRVQVASESSSSGHQPEDQPEDQPELLAEGDIRIGCVDEHSFRPRRIPAGLLEKLSA